MPEKIGCRDCRRTCCDDVELALLEGKEGLDPKGLKTGDWFYVAGITWAKKKNGLWKCRAFDSKKRLCKIYSHRPPLCRGFSCKWGKRRRGKMPLNNTKGYGDATYKIIFTWDGINERPS